MDTRDRWWPAHCWPPARTACARRCSSPERTTTMPSAPIARWALPWWASTESCCSATLELRGALFLEGGHAFGVILGAAHDRHVRGHEVEVRAQVQAQALVDE